MKAMHSEQYYRDNWDSFIKKVPGTNYINLEADMQILMQPFIDAGLPDEAIEILKKQNAQVVVDKCKQLVYSELYVIQRIEAGESSFGYTTEIQENKARSDYRLRFEFNCLQLSDFKKKYGVA